ncbi:MAG: ribosome maturation factor RimM [Gammaproteobacteria bacterium]|nr:ribosome maturation factor RimM [Gammaproteobacteria bacterium]
MPIGRISGVFGVQGWVKVFSYTSPRVNVVQYSPWHVRQNGEEVIRQVIAGQAHGDGVVAALAGIEDRDAAEALIGAEIEVDRATLGPELGADAGGPVAQNEFFWVDLQGMEVRTRTGTSFGFVEELIETGANDVMIVVGSDRYLIPFLYGSVVESVDGDRRVITVDWDPDF